jgi:ribosomal protein S18 acetylase RimI-like enzyme
MMLDARIQAYLRATAADGRAVVGTGPFTATFSDDPLRYFNYAIPDDGAAPAADQVAALTAAYEARDRLPRLEYVESRAPALAATLEAAGYTLESRLDLMTCTPDTLRAPAMPDGATLEVVEAGSAADHVAVVTARAAFPDGGDPAEDASLGTSVGVLARVDGEPAGAGQFTAPLDGLTELAGIGVLEPFRRRGIGAAVTARLAAEAFARGVTIAFLTPGDDDTRRIYERAGFAATSTVLAYARER